MGVKLEVKPASWLEVKPELINFHEQSELTSSSTPHLTPTKTLCL